MAKLLNKVMNIVGRTTVLAALFSFTASASPLKNVPGESSGTANEETQPLDENLSVTKPPPVPEHPAPIESEYVTYQQALTIRFGEAVTDGAFKTPTSVLGFEFLFPKFLSPKLEAGADLHLSGGGHVYAGLRWYYFERSYFRPSVKLSADHFFNPADGLATLVNKNDWYARGTATLEYMVSDPYSVRLESEILIGLDHMVLTGIAGLSRGW